MPRSSTTLQARPSCSASTVEKGFEGNGSNVEAAKKIGATVAERALAKGIENVVFDRGGYIYPRPCSSTCRRRP